MTDSARPGARALVSWLRRLAAIPVALVAFICAVGAVKSLTGKLPDSGVGSGIFFAVVAAGLVAGAFFLIRPDVRALTAAEVRQWLLTKPLGQAVLLYVAAVVLMIPFPKLAILPGFAAQCAYAVLAPLGSRRARSWWAHAALAVVGFVLLMGALAGTAESLTPRGFGEGGMIFLLPMYVFPILLAVTGVVRLVRRPPAVHEASPDARPTSGTTASAPRSRPRRCRPQLERDRRLSRT